MATRQSATAAAKMAMSAGSAARTASSICARRLDADHLDAGRIGQVGRPADERHLGAERRGLGGDRRALLAGGAVGDVAHRIDRLVRRPAGDEHVAAGERAALRAVPSPTVPRRASGTQGRRWGTPSSAFDRLHQLRHLGEAAGAGLAALGHLADVGPDELHAVGLQQRHVAARRRMEPHARVHGGRHQHRLVGGHQHAGGEIVGMAAGHLGQQVGGGRRHHDQVGLARQADVADLALVVEVEQLGEDALVG